MSPLARILARRIEVCGPMTVADYMAECLLHPEYGYYSTRDPFGAAGDFTTAPEISQMFGELLGLCLARSWLDRGSPAPFALAELGPGRGTLMADMLRAAASVPGFLAAAQIHLVEASPALRAVQAEALSRYRPVWHDSAEGLPPVPLFLVANEFFDALPIRQFVREGCGWRERVIGLAEGRLAFGLSAPASLAALAHRLDDTHDGDIVETRSGAEAVCAGLARHIAGHGGVAVIVDYGGWRSLGDTLQALRLHAPEDPLARPGEADLTAHVDFEALAAAATTAGAAHSELLTQGVLLERLGITERARVLAQNLSGPALESHVSAHRRLTHPQEMGTLFKALALHAEGESPPPGFGRYGSRRSR